MPTRMPTFTRSYHQSIHTCPRTHNTVAPDAIPQKLMEGTTDVVFVSLLVVLTYCIGSSLLGKEPGALPLISDRVRDRMPTIDMFDDQGRFMPPSGGKGKKGDNDDKKKK